MKELKKNDLLMICGGSEEKMPQDVEMIPYEGHKKDDENYYKSWSDLRNSNMNNIGNFMATSVGRNFIMVTGAIITLNILRGTLKFMGKCGLYTYKKVRGQSVEGIFHISEITTGDDGMKITQTGIPYDKWTPIKWLVNGKDIERIYNNEEISTDGKEYIKTIYKSKDISTIGKIGRITNKLFTSPIGVLALAAGIFGIWTIFHRSNKEPWGTANLDNKEDKNMGEKMASNKFGLGDLNKYKTLIIIGNVLVAGSLLLNSINGIHSFWNDGVSVYNGIKSWRNKSGLNEVTAL